MPDALLPNPASEKVVDLAAYRRYRQALAKRRRELIDGYPAPEIFGRVLLRGAVS